MFCANIEDCFEQIGEYYNGHKSGQFLLVNTENYDIYQEILQRFQADNSKKCIYVSEYCYPNGLPDVDSTLLQVIKPGEYVLIGISQALMMQSESALEHKIDEILGYSIQGRCIILLDHCEWILKKYINRDLRVQNRVILCDGDNSILPQIKIAPTKDYCNHNNPLEGLNRLISYLENISNRQIQQQPVLTVVSNLPINIFSRAMYSVSKAPGAFECLTEKYSDLVGIINKNNGTENQWKWLLEKLYNHNSFSELVCEFFGNTNNLSVHLSEIMMDSDENIKWFLWLSLKVFGEKNNKYLTRILEKCESIIDFEKNIYLELVDIDVVHPEFERYYSERKHLIEKLQENIPLISKYCEKLGRHQKNEIHYLTENSYSEKYEFVRCLSIYEYDELELKKAIYRMSKSLTLYMQDFIFDVINTKLPSSDSEFRKELTQYFKEYKMQKLINRIYPEFIEKVNQYAIIRPYNKLQPRSSIISHMNKNDAQLFFFDALGVEYLAFILGKCEEYGLMAEISVGHCDLPSITEKNKEFLQYFSNENYYKIDKLDEMKHHSQIYNYQKCEYPLHIFEELDVIDEELKKIRSLLVQESIKKAIIVSDHGASRLAVRYGKENEAIIKLDELGKHSGRCCPTDKNPELEFGAYVDGFAVLANYERFKGGRLANVEVHGGASLEEVLVPIIVLSKRPEEIEICFVNPIINLKPRIIPEVILYSNIPLQKPIIFMDGEYIEGEFIEDKKHVQFMLPKIKRKGKYLAEIYDGDKKLGICLEIIAQKQTREVDLF